MTKEKARKLFEEEVSAISVQQMEKLTKYMFVEQFEYLTQQFCGCFKDYCQKIVQMQQAGEKGSLGYIHFSLLYTDILARNYQLRIDAYDKNWYSDRVECIGTYDVGDMCLFLDEFTDILLAERKKYVFSVSEADVKQLVIEESVKYRAAIIGLIRQVFYQTDLASVFQEVLREDLFIISVGDFQDASTIVYKEDRNPKEAKDIKELLGEKQEVGHTYEVFEHLDLSGSKFQNLNLAYSSGEGSDFSNSNFQNARILFCKFPQAVFKQVNFSEAFLLGTDFSGATLEDVDFRDTKLYLVSFENATLINVDFSKAEAMAQINLTNATLINTIIPIPSEEVVS